MISIVANFAGVICIILGTTFAVGGGCDIGRGESFIDQHSSGIVRRGSRSVMIALWLFFAAVVLMAFVAQPYVREVCADIFASLVHKVRS